MGQDRDYVHAELATLHTAHDRPGESDRHDDRWDGPSQGGRLMGSGESERDPGNEPDHGQRQHTPLDQVTHGGTAAVALNRP